MTVTVLAVDDAFTRAVSEARDRLSAREGRTVSWREVVRRSGFDDSLFGRISYHLLPRERDRGQHLVPKYLIEALPKALPISRAELMRAAAEASGYDVATAGDSQEMDPDDVVVLVTRTIESAADPSERSRISSEVMEAIARTMRRGQDKPDETPPSDDEGESQGDDGAD